MPYHDDVRNLDAPCACATLNNTLLGAEVTLPTPDRYVRGEIKKRKVNPTSNMLLGTYNDNSVLDTQIYEVEIPDGTYNDYSANV